MLSFMISTSDNPFNPFTQHDDWYRYDVATGYNTMGYLNRLVPYSPSLDETGELDSLLEDAMEDMLRLNIYGNYIKVNNPETSKNE